MFPKIFLNFYARTVWWIVDQQTHHGKMSWTNLSFGCKNWRWKAGKLYPKILKINILLSIPKPVFSVSWSFTNTTQNMKYLPVWKSGGGDNGGTDEIIKGSTTSNTEFGLGARPFRIDGLLDGGWCISDIGDINSEIGLWLPPERWKKV